MARTSEGVWAKAFRSSRYSEKRSMVRGELAIQGLFASSRPLLTIGTGILGGVFANRAYGANPYMFGYAAITVLSILFGGSSWRGALRGRLSWAAVPVVGAAPAVILLMVLAAFFVAYTVIIMYFFSSSLHSWHNNVTYSNLEDYNLLLAPFAETYIFQGWLQTVLYRAIPTFAIPVTVVVFMTGHPINVYILAAAILLSALRYWTKSLGAVMICHLTLNLAVFIARKSL